MDSTLRRSRPDRRGGGDTTVMFRLIAVLNVNYDAAATSVWLFYGCWIGDPLCLVWSSSLSALKVIVRHVFSRHVCIHIGLYWTQTNSTCSFLHLFSIRASLTLFFARCYFSLTVLWLVEQSDDVVADICADKRCFVFADLWFCENINLIRN